MMEWYMDSGQSVAIFLCDAKIDDKGGVPQIMETHHNILQFDVTMDIIM